MLIGLLALAAIIAIFLLTSGRDKALNNKVEETLVGDSYFSVEEDKPLTKRELFQQKVDSDLARAGIPLKATEYIRLRILTTLFAFAVPWFLTRNIVLAALFGIVWVFVPPIAVRFAEEKKRTEFEEQLPGALSLIRNSLEAGMSFMQAIELVATEMDAPISEEFSRVLHESRVGKDLDVVLLNLLNRVRSQELKLVVVAVLIQREVGGNLGDIIDVILETIKDRIQIKGEIRTLTSQGRLSAIIISVLPVLLGAVMYLLNPEYMRPLFTTPLGQTLIGVAVFLEIIGIYMISRIVRVDF